MDWTRPIDAYCERLGPEFWAEPLNAITNGAFFVAAFVCLVYARRCGVPMRGSLLWLWGLLIAIGIGSSLFHTFGTVWAAVTDVVPIYLFALSYLFIALKMDFGVGPLRTLLSLCLVAGVVYGAVGLVPEGAVTLPAWVRGGLSYFPALLAMIGFAAALAVTGRQGGRTIATAAVVFTVSLTFRSVDGAVCPAFPLGTHFMWHLLNGVVLGLLVMAHVDRMRRRAVS